MPTSKHLSNYEHQLYTYVEAGFKTGLRLTCTTKKAAKHLQLRLYGFREALRAEGHPYLAFADALVLRVRDNDLYIERVGRVSIQGDIINIQPLHQEPATTASDTTSDRPARVEQPLISQPVLSSEPLTPVENPMESALEKLGFFAGVKAREGGAKDPK